MRGCAVEDSSVQQESHPEGQCHPSCPRGDLNTIPLYLLTSPLSAVLLSTAPVASQAADRGAFICQSQSMNVHMAEASFGKLSSMHFYAWKKGLKTGMYYLRTRPKADAIQVCTNVLCVDLHSSYSSPYVNKQHTGRRSRG